MGSIGSYIALPDLIYLLRYHRFILHLGDEASRRRWTDRFNSSGLFIADVSCSCKWPNAPTCGIDGPTNVEPGTTLQSRNLTHSLRLRRPM